MLNTSKRVKRMVDKVFFGENKNVEFKREIPKKHEKFLKDIIAFSNCTGGKVILGDEKLDVYDMTIAKMEDMRILCKVGRNYMPTHAFNLMTGWKLCRLECCMAGWIWRRH